MARMCGLFCLQVEQAASLFLKAQQAVGLLYKPRE
jgi:hypothetical protein